MADDRKRHPLNAPGPFYVVHGCCTACGVPTSTAPDLFAFDGENHCYVRRQPTSQKEIDHALLVLWGQELGCVRYGGGDATIRHRLAEADVGSQSDIAPPSDVRAVLRNCVTFQVTTMTSRTFGAAPLLELFRQSLPADRYRSTGVVEAGGRAQFSLSWFKNDFHKVMLKKAGPDSSRWLLQHSGSYAISHLIDDWIHASGNMVRSHRWYSESELRSGGAGFERPW